MSLVTVQEMPAVTSLCFSASSPGQTIFHPSSGIATDSSGPTTTRSASSCGGGQRLPEVTETGATAPWRDVAPGNQTSNDTAAHVLMRFIKHLFVV